MFVDTNVLVYARFGTAPDHVRARSALAEAGRGGERVKISRQILREYLATVTRPHPWGEPLAMSTALADVARYAEEFEILEDGADVSSMLAVILRDVPVAGRQIHDANIVATMLASEERRLLTFNAADFVRYGDRLELVDLP